MRRTFAHYGTLAHAARSGLHRVLEASARSEPIPPYDIAIILRACEELDRLGNLPNQCCNDRS